MMNRLHCIDREIAHLQAEWTDERQRQFLGRHTLNAHHRLTRADEAKIAWIPKFDGVNFDDVLRKSQSDAHVEAYDTIKLLMAKSPPTSKLQLATAESLTGGMILSTLVDVPLGGAYKYGGFGVYDTDAKRLFLGVREPDVYTHACTRQMAAGVLQNSNATIAVAVSGNAMPEQGLMYDDDHLKMLGEVFIAVASYNAEHKIFVDSKVYNFCELEYGGNEMAMEWINTVRNEVSLHKRLLDADLVDAAHPKHVDGYNTFTSTSMLSRFIRLQTVIQSLKDVQQRLADHTCCVPGFIQTGRVEGNTVNMNKIPPAQANNLLLSSTRGWKASNEVFQGNMARDYIPRNKPHGSRPCDMFASMLSA
jgi:PncC family amidohydrolase